MHILISVAFFLSVFFWLLTFLIALAKRIILLAKLSHICDSNSYKLLFPRFFLASFFRVSKKPDITVETSDTLYCIRILTCLRRKLYYHFVDEEHCVKVRKIAYNLSRARGRVAISNISKGTFIAWKKLLKFEKMITPASRKKTVKIMLFNPSPLLISRRDERGVYEHAFNFTDIYGYCALDARKLLDVIAGETNIEEMQNEKSA